MAVESLMRRYKSAETASTLFRSMYERCYQLAAPNQNAYDKTPGSLKSPGVFDSTPQLAADSFVNTFINTVCPVHTKWSTLEPGVGLPMMVSQIRQIPDTTQEDLDEIKSEFNNHLGEITENLFAYINSSNFYSAMASAAYDVMVGTCCLLIMPGDERVGIGSPVNYRAIPPSHISLEEGAYGEISAVFRKICVKKRDVELEWPDMKIALHEEDDEEVEFIEATVFNPKQNRWDYFVIKDNKYAVTRHYRSNPWVVFRWSVIPGETWGRGPMIKALPDAQQLNAAKELSIRSQQLSAFGCHTVINDDIINPNAVRVVPGGFIPVKRNAGPSGPSIQALPGIGNVQAQMLQIQELQNNIKRMLLDETLPPTSAPGDMTATEVLERVRKIQRDFGAVFGRISYELLQPILQRSIDILVDKGLLFMPQELTTIDSFTVKMKVVSPIARMQSMQDVESLSQVIQMLGSISPELVQTQVKLEDLGPWLADKLGAPGKFIRSKEEQDQLKQQMQQAQQQEQMQQMALQQQAQGQEQAQGL